METLGDGEGQGSLACCSPWGHEEPDMTEQLNNGSNNSGKEGLPTSVTLHGGKKKKKPMMYVCVCILM